MANKSLNISNEKKQEIMKWLAETTNEYKKLMTYYECAMMEIETKFKVLSKEYSLLKDRVPINSIKCRLKTPESIVKKLDKYGLELNIDNIQNNISDIAGIRVICSFVGDVYSLAESLMKQDDINILEIKDYIKNPKANGYRSLHLIVEIPIFLEKVKKLMKVEIQLRTIAMDFWASLEHQLRYKKDFLFTEEMVKELYECAEMSAKLDYKMDNLKKELNDNINQ